MAGSLPDRWYADWFNQDYLDLYVHRNASEARSVADLIAARLPDVRGGLTLDLGCGAGRHLPFLGERQTTIGLDLSPWLLGVARERHPASPLARGDMRTLPFLNASFTLVVSLFTSFGYFREDEENHQVLEEVARVTAPGGWLVLDFLNASHTRRTLVPSERTRVGTQWVQQTRRISDTGHFVTKTIRLEASGREFIERVRLFEPDELSAMLTVAGFEVADLYGDYGGGMWTPASPRAVVFARRRAAANRAAEPDAARSTRVGQLDPALLHNHHARA